VVMHVDGTVVSRMELYSMAYFDLDRVEVLRGPQGTLYGRNSTGGTINLVTAKPTKDFEGYFNATLGNYDLNQEDLAVGGPLSDRVQGRIAVDSIQRSGYGKNITTGHDIDDLRRWAARAQVNFDISEDARFLLSQEYATEKDAAGLFSYLGLLYPALQSNKGFGAVAQGGFSDPNSRDAAGYFDPQLERQTWSTTGTVEWTLNDRFKVRNILNSRGMHFWLAQDLALSSNISGPAINGFAYGGVGVNLEDHHDSEEFQLIHDGDVFGRPLHGIAGAYYFHEYLTGYTNVGEFPTTPLSAQLSGNATTTAEAGFWNVDYGLTETLSVRVGGRYNHESRQIVNHTLIPSTGAVITPAIANEEKSFDKYTGEYGVDFRPASGILLYATYSQGFRSGAGLTMQSNSAIVKPTTVENSEIGIKTEWLNKTLQLNLAVYSTKIFDLQRTKAYPNPATPAGFSTSFLNVADLNVKGIELESEWVATDRFRLSAAVDYVDAKFGDYVSQDQLNPNFPLSPLSVFVQVAGNRPALSPVWKGNLHPAYDFSLPKGVLTLSADANYTGKQFFDEFNRAPFEENGYMQYDAELAFKPAGGNWEVSAWGRNLSNEKRIADAAFSSVGRVLSKTYIPPLTAGVSLHMRF
jgi:iron complex outermembrane recepter protein